MMRHILRPMQNGENKDPLVQKFWTQGITKGREEKLVWYAPIWTIFGPNGVGIRHGGKAQEIRKVSRKLQQIYAEEC